MSTKSSQAFLDLMERRRTIYSLNKKSPIPDARIQEIIKHAVKHVPSSFNSQTTRIVLLLGKEHDKLWDITKEVLKTIVPEDKWEITEKKLNGFQAGKGTILFYDDRSVVKYMMENFTIYADKFEGWAQESTAMHQYAIWTTLEAEGLGANLQHYNPLIDTRISSEWNVPETWQLRAQMVIGGVETPAKEKTFKPVDDERFFVYGA